MEQFTGVKVFSATKARERESLGEVITNWIEDHPECRIVERQVLQSSDSEFHCLTFALFFVKEIDRNSSAGSG